MAAEKKKHKKKKEKISLFVWNSNMDINLQNHENFLIERLCMHMCVCVLVCMCMCVSMCVREWAQPSDTAQVRECKP